METPEFIRQAYLAPENETAEQRRKRLASKRAAKHRYLTKADKDRREQNKERQQRWRDTLDEEERRHVREQNRLRQKVRRTKQTTDDKQARNEKQRLRRAQMDEQTLAVLREREKLRARRRRRREKLPAGSAQSHSDSSATDAGAAPTTRQNRNASSPVLAALLPSATSIVLPPATVVRSGTLGNRVADLLDQQQLPASPAASATRAQPQLLQLLPQQQSQSHPQPQPHAQHPPIEIAPLQFVLPPASSIQSLTYADRMAPLPQVQNVLPHASTLFNSAAPPLPSLPSLPPLPPLPPLAASTTSTIESLLNPPQATLPSLSPVVTSSTHVAVLPSLSQLPDLSVRDPYFFDSASFSANGFFPSIAEFTGDTQPK